MSRQYSLFLFTFSWWWVWWWINEIDSLTYITPSYNVLQCCIELHAQYTTCHRSSGYCNIGYPFETHLKVNSPEISIVHNNRFSLPTVSKFCTGHGCITAVFYEKKNRTTENTSWANEISAMFVFRMTDRVKSVVNDMPLWIFWDIKHHLFVLQFKYMIFQRHCNARNKTSDDYIKSNETMAVMVCTDEFLAQTASNAENVSIWWRYHAIGSFNQKLADELLIAPVTCQDPWQHVSCLKW